MNLQSIKTSKQYQYVIIVLQTCEFCCLYLFLGFFLHSTCFFPLPFILFCSSCAFCLFSFVALFSRFLPFFPIPLLITRALSFILGFNKKLLVQGQGNKRQPTAVTAPKLVPRGPPQAFHNDCTVEAGSLELALNHSRPSHLLPRSPTPLPSSPPCGNCSLSFKNEAKKKKKKKKETAQSVDPRSQNNYTLLFLCLCFGVKVIAVFMCLRIPICSYFYFSTICSCSIFSEPSLLQQLVILFSFPQ